MAASGVWVCLLLAVRGSWQLRAPRQIRAVSGEPRRLWPPVAMPFTGTETGRGRRVDEPIAVLDRNAVGVDVLLVKRATCGRIRLLRRPCHRPAPTKWGRRHAADMLEGHSLALESGGLRSHLESRVFHTQQRGCRGRATRSGRLACQRVCAGSHRRPLEAANSLIGKVCFAHLCRRITRSRKDAS